MSVATLRSEARLAADAVPRLQRGRGVGELSFARDAGTTRLKHLFQQTPYRFLFPTPEIGDPALAVLLTTSGGLTGGDELRLDLRVEAGAEATLTTQAAEKLYRSLGPDVHIDNRFTVEDDAYLEYLPQEAILFDGARLARQNLARLAPTGKFLACDMVVFGRAAHHEQLHSGRIHDSWRIWRGNKLIWADAFALEGDIAAQLQRPLAAASATAIATAVYVETDAERLLPLARKLLPASGCRGGVSVVNGILLARFLGSPVTEVRTALTRYIRGLRAGIGWPARLPRVWNI